MAEGEQLPPIQIGQVGKVLYVIDGHHRFEAAEMAGHATIMAVVRRYRSLEEAHRAALGFNHDHGKKLSNREKQNALQSYITNNMHVYGPDDLDGPPGTVKSLRRIAAECPVYDFRTIGRKLKELGIAARRDDVKPFAAASRGEWNGPTEDDIAEEDEIALKTLRDRLAEAKAAWAILSPNSREEGVQAFREALREVQQPEPDWKPLAI